MKNKRGFTLIELLAVIVILAIVALIATPIVLNMIKTAKERAAISSALGYIETIDNYQSMKSFLDEEILSEGKHDIIKENINNKLNMKGRKASAGEFTLTKNGNVSSALLCMNGYLINYNSSEIIIEGHDCGLMGKIITYSLDSTEWEKSKNLTIMYPEGNYDHYLKVLNGEVKLDDEEVTLNTDIKVNGDPTLVLEEASTIEVWVLQNGKKMALKTIREEKIDNVDIIEPNSTATSGYPTLTEYGVLSSVNLNVTNSNSQDGTHAEYSIDNGLTWVLYSTQTQVNASNIKVKMVRNESKRESSVKDVQIVSGGIKDALGASAYDGKADTYSSIIPSGQYLYVDETMYNKKIKLIINRDTNLYNYVYLAYINSEGKEISRNTWERDYEKRTLELTIPENTKRIKIWHNGTSTTGVKVYELYPKSIPVISSKNIYPLLKDSGVSQYYKKVTIDYFNTSVKKLYKIDDSEWKDYSGKEIEVNLNQTIYAKGIDKNGVESETASLKATLPSDALGVNAYDGNNDTYSSIIPSGHYINVDESMHNKKIKLIINRDTNLYSYVYLAYLDSEGKEISRNSWERDYEKRTLELTIPDKTSRIKIWHTGTSTTGVKVYEIKSSS